MLRIAIALLASTLVMTDRQNTPPTADSPYPGVALALAQERAARVSNLRYELHFVVPADDKAGAGMEGRVTLRFDLATTTRPLYLDFAVGSVLEGTVNGRVFSPEVRNEHVAIPVGNLRQGQNEVTMTFRNSGAALNRNPEFMYALLVPARAREVFPCFDQPDLKGRYTVSLDVPEGWEAITNGAQLSVNERAGRRQLTFAETQPISTYLFTFAAGRFKVETAQRGQRTFRMLHRETDAEKVARNRDAIFDLHAGALDWLENYTGIPYPFGKFEFLLVPSFQFGGMEHPGSIYYNASALFLDPSATQNQKLGRASLIAHETAHMWFGDLVTMQWFNDVWMKEVFANFMAAKIVNPAFPEINHDLRFFYAHYPSAYEVDRTGGTNAIRQQLDNLNEAGTLYGAIIYQKAPIVMRQLEMLLGADNFRDGLREYLKGHAFANATWPDLIALLDARTPEDLAAWSHAWVEEPGRPTIAVELEAENGAVRSAAISQRDPYPSRGLLWSQPLKVAIGYRRDGIQVPLALKDARTPIPDASSGSAAPLYVLPNADGVAYGNIVLDNGSREYLLANLHTIGDDLRRGVVTVTLWEEMLDGRIRPTAMLDALMRALPGERNELTVQRMLGYTQQAYWRWIPGSARTSLAPKLETLLRSGLDGAKTPSLKSAWFNGLRDVALTPATLSWLERVWRQEEKIPDLVLAEPDYVTLAQELAVRGVPGSETILDEQIARTQNPDRKARMMFVRPSLSTDQAVRDRFFESLKDVKNRGREAWVLEALGYLHHPLRASASTKYVLPSLELLREIQRTGDIFFPKRWMDATLAGHVSPGVAQTVRNFVQGLPSDYPDRLRRVILSSADDLFRVSGRRTPSDSKR